MTTGNDERLARNDLGEAQTCDCGGINLVIGAVTLHFAPAEVGSLHELVAAAARAVPREAGATVTPLRRRGKGKTVRPLH